MAHKKVLHSTDTLEMLLKIDETVAHKMAPYPGAMAALVLKIDDMTSAAIRDGTCYVAILVDTDKMIAQTIKEMPTVISFGDKTATAMTTPGDSSGGVSSAALGKSTDLAIAMKTRAQLAMYNLADKVGT